MGSAPQPQLPELTGLVTVFARAAYWKGQNEVFDQDALVTTDDGNRWNADGEPTVYLAGDPGVALIEAGRHATRASGNAGFHGVIWCVRVAVAGILDLRRREVRELLGLEGEYWFLARASCRGLARALRDSDACVGVLTQSAGLPDLSDRWNLVLFADQLSRPLSEVISEPTKLGGFGVTAHADEP